MCMHFQFRPVIEETFLDASSCFYQQVHPNSHGDSLWDQTLHTS